MTYLIRLFDLEITMTDLVPGIALKLGKNSYIPMADDPQTTQSGELTLELWAYINAMDAQANLVHKQGVGNTHYQLTLENDEGRYFCQLAIGSSVLTADITNPFNRWIHFSFTVEQLDEQSQIRLLIDGKTVAETRINLWQDNFGDVSLGGGLEGNIAELRRWSRAWPAALIKARRKLTLNGIEPDLASWLPLNQVQQIKDRILGREFQGVLVSWIEKVRPFLEQKSQVLFLDQADESVSAVWTDDFPVYRFTFEFWYRSFHGLPGSYLVDYSGNDGTSGVKISNPQSLTIEIAGVSADTEINLVNGAWQHIAVCWNKRDGKLLVYQNGVLKGGERTLHSENIIPAGGMIKLGGAIDNSHSHPGSYFADIRVWATCRTSDEIINNFLNRQEGDEYPLRLYWPLAQQTGNQVETPSHGGSLAVITGGRWREDSLVIQASPAERLRQLRTRADLYDDLPEPGGDGPGEVVADLGLAFDADVFLNNLVGQLSQVESSQYQLTNIGIDAKVILSTESSKIIVPYPDRLTSLDPGHYTNLSFNFSPAYLEPTTNTVMPYLLGSTEHYAGSLLDEKQLGYRIVHRATDELGESGVVLEQFPAAESEVNQDTDITLIVGIATGN
ncbi:hypothetical protein FN961_18500 [Shewanella hanedai]|uniref:LamG domain-containing protein n=2 Tax=Shewanella hanedai TaxID=25 RepID=A0A553JK34_SHEHA|nr:hypothetical protein FN961_18500 [Shewanella hanedai]